jgi:hypothetical protein
MPEDKSDGNDEYTPRTTKDEDASHRLDVARTAWESAREHDSGTGSPHAKEGKIPSGSQSS